MKRYAFVDSNGNINSICGWGDNRDLPPNYPIPEGCTSVEIEDDAIDMTFIYDVTNEKFIVNPNPTEEHINNTSIPDLQKQIYDLTTLLVQEGIL